MFIYSTASADQKFNLFKPQKEGDVAQIAGCVVIAGKANVANNNLITMKGIVTEITEKQYELLQNNKAYKTMVDDEFLKADKIKEDPEKMVAKDMQAKDKAAPLVKKDLEKDGVKVKTEDEVKVG